MDGEKWRENRFDNGFDECFKLKKSFRDVEDYDCDNGLPSYKGIKIDLICKKCGNRENNIPGTLCCGQDMVKFIILPAKKLEKLGF
jgi:hypothetical protein